jgi:hypothetical protein
VYGDEVGETHLTKLQLSAETLGDNGRAVRRGLENVPATTVGMGEMLERRPTQDLHTAPRRQLVIVLRGAFEITTTMGDHYRFGPGDCLFADDLDTKGHTFEDVGDEFLETISVGISTDWEIPAQ